MSVTGAKRLPLKKEMKMRIVETATVGLMVLAAQVVVVATVFM
jgi:hypothetical protein